MGIRINKAIGWGIPTELFESNVAFEIGEDGLDESLYEKLSSITELVIPERSVNNIFENWRGFIYEPNLLKKRLSLTGQKDFEVFPSAENLHIHVSDYDGDTKIHLFLPNGAYYDEFYRYDNTLDYTESRYNLNSSPSEPHTATGKLLDDPCQDLLVKLEYNPYPWTNDLMDAAGAPVSWDLNNDAGIVPRPPAELRWWLTSTGILKEDAWKLLRPYYAKWWS